MTGKGAGESHGFTAEIGYRWGMPKNQPLPQHLSWL